jgi:hypothetical protein
LANYQAQRRREIQLRNNFMMADYAAGRAIEFIAGQYGLTYEYTRRFFIERGMVERDEKKVAVNLGDLALSNQKRADAAQARNSQILMQHDRGVGVTELATRFGTSIDTIKKVLRANHRWSFDKAGPTGAAGKSIAAGDGAATRKVAKAISDQFAGKLLHYFMLHDQLPESMGLIEFLAACKKHHVIIPAKYADLVI